MKLPDAPFYPLADLARAWGCSVEMLRVFAEHGTADGRRLKIGEATIAGATVPVVTREDREDFERSPKRERPAVASLERDSMLAVIGVLAVGWSGGDESLLAHPYTLHASLETWAARARVPMLRGDDTYARLIRDALELMARNGYGPAQPAIRRPSPREAAETSSAETLSDAKAA